MNSEACSKQRKSRPVTWTALFVSSMNLAPALPPATVVASSITATRLARSCFVHPEFPTVHHLAIQRGDGCVGRLVCLHSPAGSHSRTERSFAQPARAGVLVSGP